MYTAERAAVIKSAKSKALLLRKRPLAYFIASIAAGGFVGFGVLLAFTIGGLLQGDPYARILMGISFGIALSLVTIAGGELFTGNNLILSFAAMDGAISWPRVLHLWAVCWLGNFVGGTLLAICFWGSGLANGPIGEFMATSAAAKTVIPIAQLFLRAFLCNILVCLAVWCGFRSKSESGKLIMISWCVFTFVTVGFEHAIANITLLTIAMLSPYGTDISLAGCVYNSLVTTLGNVAGGLFCVAIPYFMISHKPTESHE